MKALKLIQECALAQKSNGSRLDRVSRRSNRIIEPIERAFQRNAADRLEVLWRSPQSSIEDTSIRDAVAERCGGHVTWRRDAHYTAMRHFLNVITGTMPAYRSCHIVKEPQPAHLLNFAIF